MKSVRTYASLGDNISHKALKVMISGAKRVSDQDRNLFMIYVTKNIVRAVSRVLEGADVEVKALFVDEVLSAVNVDKLKFDIDKKNPPLAG